MKKLVCLLLCFVLAHASDGMQETERQRLTARVKLVPLKLFEDILNAWATADSKRDPALKKSSQAMEDHCMQELHQIKDFSKQRTVLVYSLEGIIKKRDNALPEVIKDVLQTVRQCDETIFELKPEDVDESMERLARMGWCAYLLGNDVGAEDDWRLARENDDAKRGLTTLGLDCAVKCFNEGKQQQGLECAQYIQQYNAQYLNATQQEQLKQLIAKYQDDAAQ